jgi:hypothetical protein
MPTLSQLARRRQVERTKAAKQLARAAFVEHLAATSSETPLDEKVQRMLQVNRPNVKDPAQLQEIEEPAPARLHPVDMVVAEIIAEYGHDYDGRVTRAAELVKSGRVDFSEHKTVFYPHGKTGFFECQCGDAKFRKPRSKIGCACKHCWSLFIQMTLETQARETAYAHLLDKIERRR